MKQFEISYKVKNPIRTGTNKIVFQGFPISFNKEEGLIKQIKILVKSDNNISAEKIAEEIIKKLNNFFCFVKGFFVAEEDNPEIKNLTDKKNLVTKTLTVQYDIENNINFEKALQDYNQYQVKSDELEKLLSIFGDAFRAVDKELKFLAFYKVISEFGKKEHGKVDCWLRKNFPGIKRTERKRIDSQQIKENSWPINLRHSIMYDEQAPVSDDNLFEMKKYARIYIKKLIKKNF